MNYRPCPKCGAILEVDVNSCTCGFGQTSWYKNTRLGVTAVVLGVVIILIFPTILGVIARNKASAFQAEHPESKDVPYMAISRKLQGDDDDLILVDAAMAPVQGQAVVEFDDGLVVETRENGNAVVLSRGYFKDFARIPIWGHAISLLLVGGGIVILFHDKKVAKKALPISGSRRPY